LAPKQFQREKYPAGQTSVIIGSQNLSGIGLSGHDCRASRLGLPRSEPEAGQRVRQALQMRGVSVQAQRKIPLEKIEQYEEAFAFLYPENRPLKLTWY
jgi:hypothetical protein